MAEASATSGGGQEVSPGSSGKALNPWVPIIAVVILMPVISVVVTNFILIPSLKGAATEPVVKTATASKSEKSGAHGAAGAKGEKDEAKSTSALTYDFENIIVNLSGASGTKYLKASFTVSGSSPELRSTVLSRRSELVDIALNIMSSKTLVDLEAAGGRNMLRHDLIESFNQALNSNLIEQIYFSEFVIQ